MSSIFKDRSIQAETAGNVWVPAQVALPPVVIVSSLDNNVTGITLPASRLSGERHYRSAWATIADAHAEMIALGYRAGETDTLPTMRGGTGILPKTHRLIYRLVDAAALDPDARCFVHFDAMEIDQEIQSRAAINPETVERYRAVYEAGKENMPPIVLFEDANGKRWLADGFTRTAAAKAAGLTVHTAVILKGDRRDAMLYAAAANLRHGAPPSAADRRHAVEKLLRDPEWSKWANHEIARRTGSTHTTVAKVRAELTARKLVPNPATADTRTYTRNGVTQTMNTGGIGKSAPAPKPAAPPTDHIKALRAIDARAAEHPQGWALKSHFMREYYAAVDHLIAHGYLVERNESGAIFISLSDKGNTALYSINAHDALEAARSGSAHVGSARGNIPEATHDPSPEDLPVRLVEDDPAPRTYAIGDRVEVTQADGKVTHGTVRKIGVDELYHKRAGSYAVYLDAPSASTHWYHYTMLFPAKPDDAPPPLDSAFSASQIVETRRRSLLSKAVSEVRVLTNTTVLFAHSAFDLRYNDGTGYAEMRTITASDVEEWFPLPAAAIAEFAQAENLNWLLPNGSIFLASDPIERLPLLLGDTEPMPPIDPPSDDTDLFDEDDLLDDSAGVRHTIEDDPDDDDLEEGEDDYADVQYGNRVYHGFDDEEDEDDTEVYSLERPNRVYGFEPDDDDEFVLPADPSPPSTIWTQLAEIEAIVAAEAWHEQDLIDKDDPLARLYPLVLALKAALQAEVRS